MKNDLRREFMESDVDITESSSFFNFENLYTNSLVAFKHCIVELKKQVFPRFFKPREHIRYSENLPYSRSLDSSSGSGA